MDTFGALALGTEPPTSSVLKRKPYKRNSSLISYPMIRNILAQSSYQVTLLFILLFLGSSWFNVRMLGSESCLKFKSLHTTSTDGPFWDVTTMRQTSDRNLADISCSSFGSFCDVRDSNCLESSNHYLTPVNATLPVQFSFAHLDGYQDKCLDCEYRDYTHGTIIFNTFVFCQVFLPSIFYRLHLESSSCSINSSSNIFIYSLINGLTMKFYSKKETKSIALNNVLFY